MDSPEAPQVLNNVYQLSRQLSLTAPHEVCVAERLYSTNYYH